MKKSILTIIEGVLIIAFLFFAVDWTNRGHREEINNKTKIENELKAANLLLEHRLGTSERQRLVLVHRADSLDLNTRSLVRANSKLDSTLKTVKGKYKGRTITELETEMISRWQGK